MGNHLGQRPLQLADVGSHQGSDTLEQRVGQVDAVGDAFGCENRLPCLHVWRLDVGNQAPFEARAQPVFQGGHGLGRAVTGQHYLSARFVQGVERMEQLLLRAGLAGQELHIVDQQHVAGAVLGPELLLGVVARNCS